MSRTLRNRAPPPPDDDDDLSELSEPQNIDDLEEDLPQAGKADRGSASDDGEDDGDDDEMPVVAQLRFNQELTWTVGRAPTAKVLLRRLEDLYAELQSLDQEVLDVNAITHICEGLSHRNMLTHKDPGVRAYAVCCIVELLRVTAPNAPFVQAQLQAIFTTIIGSIIPHLANTSDPYHGQHVAIINSLADIKSVVLMTDIDGADDFVYEIFVKLFDVGDDMKASDDASSLKSVQTVMVGIMVVLIEESEAGIPVKVIDSIMAQFLRAIPSSGRSTVGRDSSQSTLLPKTEPVPYTMAKVLCRECHEKMSKYFAQYFNDFMWDARQFGTGSRVAATGDDDDRSGSRAPTEDELKELRRAHDLIRELWRAAPDVLTGIIPQLEMELAMDSPDMRRLATETIGDMISGIGSRGPPPPPTINPAVYPPLMIMDESNSGNGANDVDDGMSKPISPSSFMQKHSSSYQLFLGRRHDKSASIRASWVSCIGHILATSAGGTGLGRDEKAELIKELGEKLNDQDEKVRLAAIKAIESIPLPDVVRDLGRLGSMDQPGSLLANFADRCRDRRPAVRVEATVLMAKMWAAATGELMAENDDVVACLGGIPSRILNAFYANDRDINLLIDRVMYEYLLPLNFPLQKKTDKATAALSPADCNRFRTERMLLLVRHLDESARKAFFILVMRQPKFALAADKFIQGCEAFNKGASSRAAKDSVSKQMGKLVDWFAVLFPDETRAKSDLHKFVKLNDRRCYQLIKFAISMDSDYVIVSRAFKEMVKRIGASNSASPALETIVPLFYRFAYLVLNKSHLSVLIECAKTDRGWTSEVARQFLNQVSQSEPALMDSYSGQLQRSIADNAPSSSRPNEPGVAATLKAFSSFARSRSGGISTEGAFSKKLIAYALFGQPVETAKYAVTILMSTDDELKVPNAVSLMNKVMEAFTVDSPHFLNRLAAAAQLELLAPTVTQQHADAIRDVTVQKLILQTRTKSSDADPDWVSDADMDDELTAKRLALRLLVNGLRAAATEDGATASSIRPRAQAVLKMLRALIVQRGEVATAKNTPSHYRSRLVLEAALLSLKLCTIPLVDEVYPGADFNSLALVAQDRVPQVRHTFVNKLLKYMGHRKLRTRFHTIVFLTAFEPSIEYRTQIETWLRSMARGSDSEPRQPMTSIVARLISLLAHHPDYSSQTDNLVEFGRYLVYYVNLVATEANLGRIHAYTEKAKQANDGLGADKTPRVRLLCDMAQSVLAKWQHKKGWSFQACSDKVGLPIGLFTVLGSHDEAQTVAKTNYLPAAVEEKLDAYIRQLDRKGRDLKRKSMGAEGDTEPPSKKAKSKGGRRSLASRPKAKPRRAREDSEAGYGERRRSGRSTKKPIYAETDSEGDDDDGDESGDEDSDGSEGSEDLRPSRGNRNGNGADVDMGDSDNSSLSDLDPDDLSDEGGVEEDKEEEGSKKVVEMPVRSTRARRARGGSGEE